MLELEILRYLMACESNSALRQGSRVGFNISWMIKEHGIPSGTFYRAIKTLIAQKFIVRTGRGLYALNDRFRILCNRIPDGNFVKVSDA